MGLDQVSRDQKVLWEAFAMIGLHRVSRFDPRSLETIPHFEKLGACDDMPMHRANRK